MSIATMNWALQQRLASPQQQILLYVIADSADPTGVTQHCDPDYLVKHSRLSRATVFRRMNELRELGLLETFNKHGSRGMRIYEIRLALQSLVQVPLKGEQGDDGHDADDEDGGGESQAETHAQSQPETGAVSQVRPAQSHSCDSISPPVSEESSPNPLPGGVHAAALGGEAKELFDGFRGDYADSSRWGWARVEPIFALLPIEDQRRIRAAAPVYAKQIAASKPKATPYRPERFIRDRVFDNFPDARLPEKPPERVWIVEGSTDWRAMEVLAHLLDQAPPRPLRNEAGEYGMWRLGPVKPDMAALARFDPADAMAWPVAIPETREFNAWRKRYHDWSGRWPEERIVMRAGYTTKDVNGKPMTFQNRLKGLLTPCRWPPKPNGELYPDTPSHHGGEHDGAGEA